MKAKTNIIVVSWNALKYTKATINSIFSTVHHPYNLTIVDNGSDQNIVNYIKKLKPSGQCLNIDTILNRKNYGPGYANNQGYTISKKIGAKYTCLCNNDQYFSNNWLEKLENSMDNNTDFGMIGALRPAAFVEHPYSSKSAKEIVDSLSSSVSPQESLSLFFDGKSFKQGVKDLIKINNVGLKSIKCPPDMVPTCCAIVRNVAIDNIGYLCDPIYRFYGCEDTDLCWNMYKAGYKCGILYDTYVHHFRHRSVEDNGLDRVECLRMNSKIFVKKWQPTIKKVLQEYQKKGYDLDKLMSSQNSENDDFWILRRMNNEVRFFDNYSDMQNKTHSN